MRKIAFSYCRFSTAEQVRGDSLRRQLADTQDYCKRLGLSLDPVLTLRDIGVSAWKGKNVRQGALGAFLRAIETGRVPPGSVLVVESLDRISRQKPMDALALWLQILQAGVEIHTVKPERQYSAESDQWSVFEALIILGRANEESEIKSHRIAKAWKQKRAEAPIKKLTRNCPAWLRLNEDRMKFGVIPQAVKTVQYIYHLCLEGLGSSAIARRLNREKVPLIAKKSNSRTWYDSYVKKLLHTHAVLGEYQPCTTPRDQKPVPVGDPIPNYYPRIIDDATFYKVQKTLKEREYKRGRIGCNVTNLFQSLLKDECGNTMYITNRGGGKTSIASSAAMRGEPGHQYKSFPYPVFEKYLLLFLHELPAHELFATAPDIAKTQQAIADTEGRIATNKMQLNRIQKKLMTNHDIDLLVETAARLEQEQRQLQATLEELKRDLHTSTQESSLTDLHQLLQVMHDTEGDEKRHLRLKIKEAVRAIVDQIVVKVTLNGRTSRTAKCEVFFRQGGQRTISICCDMRTNLEWAIGITPANFLSKDTREWLEQPRKPRTGKTRRIGKQRHTEANG